MDVQVSSPSCQTERFFFALKLIKPTSGAQLLKTEDLGLVFHQGFDNTLFISFYII